MTKLDRITLLLDITVMQRTLAGMELAIEAGNLEAAAELALKAAQKSHAVYQKLEDLTNDPDYMNGGR